MIADEHNAEEVGADRTINGRKIPLGTWLLEKLGLCNCCPKARCAFVRERRERKWRLINRCTLRSSNGVAKRVQAFDSLFGARTGLPNVYKPLTVSAELERGLLNVY